MKTTHEPQVTNNDEQDVSQDPVWDLLRQSPAVPVSPVFADRVMRAVRQVEAQPRAEAQPSPFWAHSYAVMGSVAAMAAALTIAAVVFFLPEPAQTVVEHRPEPTDAFATLDEVASQEMLLAATDHLGEFSDTELVSLIGF
jgi:hypothetical protein